MGLDLRIMYAEYTLGATDLAHISADVKRYQPTIIRALEVDGQKDFERITEPLPTQRAGISMPWTGMRLLGSAFHGAAAVSRKISRQFGGVSTSIFPWPARPCNS